jgi:hypothetical protein
VTTKVTMSDAMDARLRAETARCFEESRWEFARALDRTMTLPMPTLSKTVTFRLTTVKDGPREFTFTVSLQELASATTTPTVGWEL